MTRHFTHYWANETAEAARASGRTRLDYVAGNRFAERGVGVGDVVYPLTVEGGVMRLLGFLEVDEVCGPQRARERLGHDPEWKASEYLLAADPAPLRFDLEVPEEVAGGLRFVGGKNESPKFSAPGVLDRQTMRGVRELSPASSAELDALLGAGLPMDPPRRDPPRRDPPRPLELGAHYTREEAHAIFAPGTVFTPQSGTWGLHGIVPIPDRPGDHVFFVTLGQSQGEHVFDEGITEDGVLSWQSQPRQGLDSPQVRGFIEHDELENSVHLFFRTGPRRPYAYLGRLKYLAHDAQRERPVYFQWQLLDWGPEVRDAAGVSAAPATAQATAPKPPVKEDGTVAAAKDGLLETPPPAVRPGGATSTPSFRARKVPDYSALDAANRETGSAGELLVVDHERRALREAGRPDLADRVRHVAALEGDGAGYDVLSFTTEEEKKHIEVKTTRGPAATPFHATANEAAFSDSHPGTYHLYRVYDYDRDRNSGRFFATRGSLAATFDLAPTQYRVSLRTGQKPPRDGRDRPENNRSV